MAKFRVLTNLLVFAVFLPFGFKRRRPAHAARGNQSIGPTIP